MASYNLLREYQNHIVLQSYNAGFVVLSYVVSLVGAGSSLELMSRRTGFRGLFNHVQQKKEALSYEEQQPLKRKQTGQLTKPRGGKRYFKERMIQRKFMARDSLRNRWNAAEDNLRSLLYTTSPKTLLSAILEATDWLAKKAASGIASRAASREATNEAEDSEDIVMDYISVTSSLSLQTLPRNETSDEGDIDIITSRLEQLLRGGPSNHSYVPIGLNIDLKEDEAIQEHSWGDGVMIAGQIVIQMKNVNLPCR
ncbi:hypothetical protein FOBRF1_007170 [Fusarium oxysporum]